MYAGQKLAGSVPTGCHGHLFVTLPRHVGLLAPKNWLERKGKAKGRIGDRVADENSECSVATRGGIFCERKLLFRDVLGDVIQAFDCCGALPQTRVAEASQF